jgi:hypothetical protein
VAGIWSAGEELFTSCAVRVAEGHGLVDSPDMICLRLFSTTGTATLNSPLARRSQISVAV